MWSQKRQCSCEQEFFQMVNSNARILQNQGVKKKRHWFNNKAKNAMLAESFS